MVILMQFDVIEMEKVILRKESYANQKKNMLLKCKYWHQKRHMDLYMSWGMGTRDSEIRGR